MVELGADAARPGFVPFLSLKAEIYQELHLFGDFA